MFHFRILILSILLSFSTYTYSLSDNTIFYPMPIHAGGQYITAQQLFLRDDGALWMYDVYGQVHLFDGANIFTLGNRTDSELPRQISFYDNKFWFIKDSKIQSWSNDQGLNVEYILPKTNNLLNINQNSGVFWGNNSEQFFVYEPETNAFYTANINEANTSAIHDEIAITSAIYINKRWVVSTSEGLFEFDTITESFTPLHLGQYIDAIFYSEETGKIILGTHDSIWIAELDGNQLNIHNKISNDLTLLSFAETKCSFWFGTEQGLYKWSLKTKKLEYFESVVRDDYSLEGNKIYALLSDNNNGVWVATDNGVSYYSDGSRLFTRVRYKEANGHLDIHEITAIQQTSDQHSWIGTSTGLFQLNNNEITSGLTEIMPYYINDLSRDNDFIWAATTSGVYRLEVKSNKVSRVKGLEVINNENIEHLLMDASGILWLSSSKGLYKYDSTTDELVYLGFYWALEQKYSTQITHIYENKNGQILIGTNMGLYRYENGALTFDYAYIRAGSILDMVDTEYGDSWIVSNYGLQISDSKGGRKDVELSAEYTTPHCVLSTSNGVWLTSSKGLSLYTHQGRLTKHFGSQRGLINNELLTDLCSISDDGTMMFVSKDGLFFADEQELLEYQITKPHVVIGQVKVDHLAVSYGSEKKLKTPIPYETSISFLFGILPEFQNKLFSYQLVGSSDESWQHFEGSSLIFDSLKPGKYVLRIKPGNNGQRSSNVTEFLFYVEVPWFLAPWFIFLLFSVAIFTVLGVYSWRSKEIKKSNEKLKKSVEIKTQQLRNQGKVLVSSNRQLQKLLTVRQHVISEMAEQAQQPIKDIQHDLQKKGSLTNLALANQCEYSLSLLKQLTHIEPLVMQQKNNRTNQVLSTLLRAAVKGWKEEYHLKGVNLCLEDSSKNCSIFVQPLLIDAIFNNVLFHLLKRSQFSERVVIQIHCDEERVTTHFISDGECIIESELEALKRVDLTQTIEVIHQALGLSSVKQLTVQNGGHFEVKQNVLGNNKLVLSWPIAIDSLIDKVPLAKFGEQINDDAYLHQRWLIGVYKIVEDNYRNPAFGTSAAAKALFISERNFQRKFKQLTQRSFMEYLIEIKLEKACELLISGYKVADSAFESGFNDPSYFSKRFKRHYGLSPTQFVSENEDKESDEL
ncbi:AraC family transcriptional regulator [Aliivibrio sifiae]|uniref:AraC family transcriptional regulator n=1 Tax=Aliivibrio sifiae TaxID=566293 RepID=UPI000769FDE1